MDQSNSVPTDFSKSTEVTPPKPDYFSSPAPPPSQPPPPATQILSRFTNKPGSKLKLILTVAVLLVLLAGATLLIISFLNKRKTVNAPISLTYWGLFEPPSVMQQVIADYEKNNPKVKINYSQENLKYYRERLQAALARNEGPDIFRVHQTWVAMMGNYLAPVPGTIYDSASFEKDFYPSARESLKYLGQYVGIPLMYDGLALFYNEDLFRAAGKSPPKTWDDLRKVAIDLTVRDSQGKIRTAGVALGTASNTDHWSDILALMMLQNGADPANPTSSLAADALSYFVIFTTTDRVWEPNLPSSTYAFATGNLAMYFGPSWRVFDIKSLNPNLNFKIIPVPQLPGTSVSWSSFWAEAVSKNSKNQAEAWKFLKYLSSKEVLQKLYNTQSSLRLFGEPYPRTDMADLIKAAPYVGAFIDQAPFAKSWYLSSNTFDNGINQQIIKYYEDAVNAVNNGDDPASALKTTAQGVASVLRQYNLTK